MTYPIITREKTPEREIVRMDYGPRQGVTTVYILPPTGTAERDEADIANLNRVLAGRGLQLRR